MPPAKAAKGADAGGEDGGPKSFARRNHLCDIADKAQAKWREEKIFETRAKYDADGRPLPKFLVTFPYPYMNGRLHLGHAYSLTKADFMTQYQLIKGVNALFPFGFHCTGMPIQVREAEPMETEAAATNAEVAVEKKGKGKKSKLVAKTGGNVVRQWDIMKMMVPEDEISAFTDPLQWLKYFPPHGKADLERFGAAVDWRRSFITTAVNPYYDSFIRWQFNTLKANDKVRFGKRANVYSTLDGQVCADHDRASGEGVGPQEYTLIKLRVLELKGRLNQLAGKDVYLAPATLRPETMYGQTNCFVLPEGVYGAYEWADGSVMIMSARGAKGLAHQGFAKEWGKVECLIPDLTGQELIGLPLSAPNATYDVVYTLPLLTISMGKGTGVVTSVPSDAPDDYAALKELKEKPQFREKFGLTDEMVMPFDVVPIINIPGYGNMSAEVMCEKLKIKSCKDVDKLKAAKEEVYLKGFYEGVMEVGPYAGDKVCDAKPKIRQEMIEAGQALPYYEPESTVMSRSGDECIVALTDQWYLPYGEEAWVKQVSEHVNSSNFTAYSQSALDKFNFTLGWLKEWACTRLFGLGTRLPWDETWVIESLSDSTIYMAYYTVAHLLHGHDNLDGITKPSPCNMAPEQFTDAVWDYIFLSRPMPSACSTDANVKATLEEMRGEFEYWYPMDLRCSAKDLIPNHLTMALYNHASIWKDRPELWPKGYWTNGHILVDAEKMSKSKGNFLMLNECIERFSADATRFACANAGDSLLDANFEVATANNAIITLTKEEEWFKATLEALKTDQLRTGPLEFFMDRAFDNEMNRLIAKTEDNYTRMMWREGLQGGFFEMQLLRDSYRDWCSRTGTAMHAGLTTRFIEVQTVILAPICPHFCEFVWGELLGKTGSVLRAGWPAAGAVDVWTSSAFLFLQKSLRNFRNTVGKSKTPPTKGQVLVAMEYPQWKKETLLYLQSVPKTESGAFPDDFMAGLRAFAAQKNFDKKQQQGLMQFAAFVRAQYDEAGPSALDVTLPYDQRAVLEENLEYARSALALEVLTIHIVGEDGCPGNERLWQLTSPGHPVIVAA
ncbi:leucyl-tRNA synthetase [Tribonema minus]|uniref:leucine--tRNA ligase n=1 Tax=Tribonema minus TaxID=303371 RepID=A0A835YRC2_9STRA|nr:leucyl-tRNA synthetase [Tribonema minus]